MYRNNILPFAFFLFCVGTILSWATVLYVGDFDVFMRFEAPPLSERIPLMWGPVLFLTSYILMAPEWVRQFRFWTGPWFED